MKKIIIDCISDLHGYYPKLDGGDLLIVAGDLTANHYLKEFHAFNKWIDIQKYKKKIVVAGNHDTFLVPRYENELDMLLDGKNWYYDYLFDSGCEFAGLKIWGSPWTLKFRGMNPDCMAFTCDTEEELAEKWALIPDDIDILITHGPPYGIFDKSIDGKKCGSQSLYDRIKKIRPKFHFYGHIHEGYYQLGGTFIDGSSIQCYNCSIVNERYEHVNKPVRVIL